jgi:ubiquinone/menaquinone biosynthesis C-methylase UbiE/ADP-ribose pyrophosphatase YjhB (NUDIX family)
MPKILSLGLFERNGRLLVARRKPNVSPFAGSWLLPAVQLLEDEAAEEALERHAFHELGIEIGVPEFAETMYLEDEASHERYVANIFRVPSHTGSLRFRASGDYDDVRWLTETELAELAVPVALRDWLVAGRHAANVAAPVPVAASGPAPDNRAAWNTISRAYQDEKRISTEHLTYGPRCPGEDELQLLGDVSGKRVIVLGCGGGQDCIVLAKQGATVIGIDLSDKQIEYGRRLAERESVLVTLVQGSVEELRGIDDETQDLALSIHALNYVERIDRAFAEAHRVLRRGSAFVIILHHPFDVCLDDTPPYGVTKSYWEEQLDWQWDFSEAKVTARMRSWYRTIGEWLSMLIDAGFRVERLLEPPPREEVRDEWDRAYSLEKTRLIPHNLIIKVVKP